jgi:hypothetical protein
VIENSGFHQVVDNQRLSLFEVNCASLEKLVTTGKKDENKRIINIY